MAPRGVAPLAHTDPSSRGAPMDDSPKTNFPALRKQFGRGLKKLASTHSALTDGFANLHRAAVAPGVLDARTKELIALSISVATQCDGCVALHTNDALRAGATSEEIAEALGVAVLMGGGPALVYATHAMEAVEQFQAD